MAPSTIPPHLVPFLSSPQIPSDAAVDALEEWILNRRSKGDTLFEISVGLVELEDRTPPHLARAFDRARYVTNIPQSSDLTPPTGPFPLSRSASPETILHHLLSYPPPTLEHSREVVLEYVLAREAKLREKKPGRGGKGTLGRDGFEDISRRLGEIEDGLRGVASAKGIPPDTPASPRNPYPSPMSEHELDEPRQLGLTLLLSLRLSLSYFTLQELADQLVVMPVADAERTLVQHIRRRVAGEGRWGVGKELDYVEGIALQRRRALKSAFRSAKARTNLPPHSNYPITLPAPTKSVCIKLLNAFAKDIDSGPHGPATPGFSPTGFARRTTYSPANAANGGSPKASSSTLSPSFGSPTSQSAVLNDPNPLANYALELVSEYLTREKREHMIKSKWAKSGRDQLSKDLGDIEAATCMIRSTAAPLAATLLPVFLLLRRTFALPSSPLPAGITEPYLDILPAPPDPDDVPLREPTVQTTTAALYVNPRLDDARALDVIEELVDTEKEHVESMGATYDEMVQWVVAQVESVEKRFPDGSYADVFATAKSQVAHPKTATEPSPLLSGTRTLSDQVSAHRRSRSHAIPAVPTESYDSLTSTPVRREQHSRSISMPLRGGIYPRDSDSDSDSDEYELPLQSKPIEVTSSSLKQLPPLQMLSPIEMDDLNEMAPSVPQSGSGGWWDVVSAVQTDNTAPWHENPRASLRKRTSSNAAHQLLLPPGAEPAAIPDFSRPYDDITELSQIDLASGPSTPLRERHGELFPTQSSVVASPTLDNYESSSPRSLLSQSQSHMRLGERERERDDRDREHERDRRPPVPIKFSRPSFPSARPSGEKQTSGSYTPTSGSPMTTPVHEAPQPQLHPPPSTPPGSGSGGGGGGGSGGGGKSKLFGRSLSLASKSVLKSRKEDKENDKNVSPAVPSGSGPGSAKKDKDKVQNNPGKWNRDMVANIMGPPAERR